VAMTRRAISTSPYTAGGFSAVGPSRTCSKLPPSFLQTLVSGGKCDPFDDLSIFCQALLGGGGRVVGEFQQQRQAMREAILGGPPPPGLPTSPSPSPPPENGDDHADVGPGG